MYERFTDRARKVMQLANQEAQRFQHNYIGTEHILLGLVKEGSGVGVYVLKSLGVEPRTITREVERFILSGCPAADTGKTPQTPRAKKVIEYAMRESRDFNHDFVGTEHILLGLLREDTGLAAQVLMNLGLRLDRVRAEIQATLQRAEDEGSTAYSPQSRIRWGYDKTKCHEYPLDDETKRRVCQLADAIVPLQTTMEDAVASQDFEQAVKVRDKRDQYWKELGSLNVPEWVWRNVKRLASGFQYFRFSILPFNSTNRPKGTLTSNSMMPETGSRTSHPSEALVWVHSPGGARLSWPSGIGLTKAGSATAVRPARAANA